MIDEELLIFGAGAHARKLARALHRNGHGVLSYITSRPPDQNQIAGIPVHSWESLPEQWRGHRQVACGIFNRSDAYDKLAAIMRANRVEHILWPWDYYPRLADALGWCYWLDEEPRTLADWREDARYHQLRGILADEESRKTLDRVLAFRSGEDLDFASYTSSEPQYFNRLSLPPLPLQRPCSYLDVGAFDGDTLQLLCRHVAVGRAVLIEPHPDNFSRLTRNLHAFAAEHPGLNALALPLGAGERYASLGISGEGEAAALSSEDAVSHCLEHVITVARLDDVMPTARFDFIKVDVEGHDLAALKGMAEILQRSQAVLAVSLYHRPRDIIELPLATVALLEGLSYSFSIRQHMHNSFDTVLYAIPPRAES